MGTYTYSLPSMARGSHYQYHANTSTGITRLTPDIVQSHKLTINFHEISRDKNSSTPDFKQKILDSNEENHITRYEPTFPGLQPQ